MEIRPATIDQIVSAKGGRMVQIDNDVQNVANDLYEIDHHLRLRYSEAGEYYVVYYKPDEGDEGDGYLVTTAQELDQRIVQRIREITERNYDYAAELDKAEAKARKEKDDAWTEKIGPIAERLAFEMRKELGYTQNHAYVPRGIPDAAA